MTNSLFRSAATVALALMLVPLTRAAEPSPQKPAPAVVLQTAQGAPSPLAEHRGRVVLIDFWASWCEPCKKSFPALDALSREFQPRGLDVLAVNLDERRRDADAFLSARPHTMTILFDPKGAAPQAFGVQGMPSSFLIDRTGTIRFTHMGYSGDVAEQYRREVLLLLSEHQP
jgi:thiol-disulfide isomerase/thioredoxin